MVRRAGCIAVPLNRVVRVVGNAAVLLDEDAAVLLDEDVAPMAHRNSV